MLSGMFVAALLGVIVARLTIDSGSSAALSRHASAGALEVSFPSDWAQQAPATVTALTLNDELTLAPTAPRGAKLIVGRAATDGSSLLPSSLVASVAVPARAQLVTLGGKKFYRYVNLAPLPGAGSEAVYALPTTVGTIVGVCAAPAGSGFRSACERVLGTVKLAAGSGTLGLSPSYASALDLVIGTLNAARSRAGSQLSHARSVSGQERAAAALARAHTQAAAAVQRLDAGSASAANSAVASALATIGRSYRALARALANNDSGAYNRARAALSRDATELSSAFTQLGRFGYSIG
ncbi:MAG: hypothetical protein JO156_04060 [Solirubrobacterales bacterium]|nr:hypothetical protein [Solirubrobacterales bacterium]